MFKSKIIAPLIFLALAVVGCGPKKCEEAKIVKINLGDDPHTLDPRLARDPNDQMLMRMFFEGLTRIGPGDRVELALAEKVDVSEDLKTYTFTLREAKWSNGDRVKAADFVYAWKTILSPEFGASNAYQLYVLKNGRNGEDLGVKALSDQVLVVELEHPTPYFLELLAMPFFFPVHHEMDEQMLIGNGPFLLTQWCHHDQLSARKNPNYWDAESVKIDGVDFFMVENDTALHLFEKGELHWAGSPMGVVPVDAISHLKNVNVKPKAETVFLRVNLEMGVLTDPKVRRALALAIDREGIVKYVTQGGQAPAMSLLPPSMALGKGGYFKESDPKLAAKLLKEAKMGQEDFKNVRLTYIQSERAHLIAQTLQEQWNRVLGIKIGLEAVERKVYFDRISRKDYDLAYCSWGADFHDPINFLEVFKYKDQSTNNTTWEDERYIEFLDQSAMVSDPKARSLLLSQCETILMDALPIIPLYYNSMVYLKDKDLEDVFLSSLGNLDFKWATLDNHK